VHTRVPGEVRVTFDHDVAGTVGQADLVVRNVATNETVSPAGFAYDAATRVATFTLPGNMRYGDYRATIARAAVTAPSGGGLPQDFVLGFFSLPGDLNRDRRVDGTDFAILAGNFGKTGMTFATGDVNGDGRVDGTDFALLAGHFGKALPNPPPVTPQTNLSLELGPTTTALVTTPPAPAPTPAEVRPADEAPPPPASVPPPAPAVVPPPRTASPGRRVPPTASPKKAAPRRPAAPAPSVTATAKGPQINDVIRRAPRR
jgi:hypothetical protein